MAEKSHLKSADKMASQLEDDVQRDLGSLEKAPLENVSKLLASRKYKLCQVTRRMNIVKELMKVITNVEEVNESMTKYGQLVEEFNNTHKAYQLLLSKEECELDTEKWYILKVGDMTAFMASVTKWKNTIIQGEIDHDNIGLNVDNVAPEDSISAVLSHRSSRSATSSTSSARIRAEAEKAAIQTRIQALKQKHALEEEEEELNVQKEQLRKRRETLELHTELAATTAKLTVYKSAEEQIDSNSMDGMNAYYDDMVDRYRPKGMDLLVSDTVEEPIDEMPSVRPKEGVQFQPPILLSRPHISTQTAGWDFEISPTQNVSPVTQVLSSPKQTQGIQISSPRQTQSMQTTTQSQDGESKDNVCSILQRQNDITSILVRQQQLSLLPQKDIAIFDGDVLQFQSFILSFEHAIESKTDNNRDRLHFLQQYTKGPAQELVRSCQLMSEQRGYPKAKSLLHEHYGNE